MMFCTGCVELGHELCALCGSYCSNSNFHTVHTARVPAPRNQCRTPYAAVHSLVLLKMGIMMPETCCDRSLIINIRLVASCWFLSSTYVHDAPSQEPKTLKSFVSCHVVFLKLAVDYVAFASDI